MTIEFKCQGCQKTLRVPDEFSGRKAKCPNCKSILQVPAGNATVEPLEVQPPIESSSDLFAGLDSLDTSDSPSNYGQPSVPSQSPFTSNPYDSPRAQSTYRRSGTPHRGGLILGLGIGALACNFCLVPGILALIFGLIDLKAMKEGRMDNEGHGLTMAGTIMGGIMTGVGVLVAFMYVLLIIGILMGA